MQLGELLELKRTSEESGMPSSWDKSVRKIKGRGLEV